MKQFLKQLGLQLALNSVFVAADQAVRTAVSHTLKKTVLKDKDIPKQS